MVGYFFEKRKKNSELLSRCPVWEKKKSKKNRKLDDPARSRTLGSGLEAQHSNHFAILADAPDKD